MIRRTVLAACAASLAIGLFFVLAWAPHPWGWEGFDDYHDLGRAVARAEPYPTMDRPWGYAYFLAAFYAFGDRPLVPLIAQVALNALMPLVVYLFARDEFDEPTAAVGSSNSSRANRYTTSGMSAFSATCAISGTSGRSPNA